MTAPTPTRFDAPDFLEVWEHAPNDEADRWIVYIGNDCFSMSDDANMPNGVCMYAGTTGDLFRPMVEGRKVEDLSTLPYGTRKAIVRELQAQERPIPVDVTEGFTVFLGYTPRPTPESCKPDSPADSPADFPVEKPAENPAENALANYVNILLASNDADFLSAADVVSELEGFMRDSGLYKDPMTLASARVLEESELEPYGDVILRGDWNEPEHFAWAATCPLAELLDWAQAVSDEAGDA